MTHEQVKIHIDISSDTIHMTSVFNHMAALQGLDDNLGNTPIKQDGNVTVWNRPNVIIRQCGMWMIFFCPFGVNDPSRILSIHQLQSRFKFNLIISKLYPIPSSLFEKWMAKNSLTALCFILSNVLCIFPLLMFETLTIIFLCLGPQQKNKMEIKFTVAVTFSWFMNLCWQVKILAGQKTQAIVPLAGCIAYCSFSLFYPEMKHHALGWLTGEKGNLLCMVTFLHASMPTTVVSWGCPQIKKNKILKTSFSGK